MPVQSHVLTDVAQGIWIPEFQLSESSGVRLSGSSDWSITKRTLRGGPSDGIDVVELNNGSLSVSILPTRGMGIWKGRYRDLELGWQSPVRLPVHPSLVNLTARGGLGWLDGFNEWLCRCGLAFNGPPCDDNGSPLTLHGRIANIPAQSVAVHVDTDGPGTLGITGIVDETSLFGPCLRLRSTVQTEAGSNCLTIIDQVTNLAGQPAEMELLYHINTGRPFLEEGSRFAAPIRELAPRTAWAADGIDQYTFYQAPRAGFQEQVYFTQLLPGADGQTVALLRNRAGNAGLSVRFRPEELPYFMLWKNTQAEADGCVTGLEPATDLPNVRPFERQQGRVITLGPGAEYAMWLEIAVHDSSDQVAAVEAEIRALQSPQAPVIHRQMQPRFSPDAG